LNKLYYFFLKKGINIGEESSNLLSKVALIGLHWFGALEKDISMLEPKFSTTSINIFFFTNM